MYSIGGDTHTVGAALAAPLRILGQQPIQNAAPSQTKFGQLIFGKIINIKAKMHQIRFRLGLRPKSRSRADHGASPDPLAGFKGSYTFKGSEERAERGREGRGRERGESGARDG